MILFRVQMRVPAALRERTVKSLHRLLGPTRVLTGCRACGAYVDVADENTLVYVEEWATQEALDGRLRVEDLRVLLSVLDLSCEPPVVRFDTISGTQGLEVIAAAHEPGLVEESERRFVGVPGSTGSGEQKGRLP